MSERSSRISLDALPDIISNKTDLDDNEEDYMTMVIPTSNKPKKRVRRGREDKERKKHKSAKQEMKESREDGLAQPINSDNKGYQILMKMGFKGTGGLGKTEQGRSDPVPVVIKESRKGLGEMELVSQHSYVYQSSCFILSCYAGTQNSSAKSELRKQ